MPTTAHTEIFNDLLKLGVDSGASDVVIKSNKPGYVRLAGRLQPVDMDPIAGAKAEAFICEHVSGALRSWWKEERQVDFAYATEREGRFRVNGFQQRGTISIVFRHSKSRVPEFE